MKQVKEQNDIEFLACRFSCDSNIWPIVFSLENKNDLLEPAERVETLLQVMESQKNPMFNHILCGILMPAFYYQYCEILEVMKSEYTNVATHAMLFWHFMPSTNTQEYESLEKLKESLADMAMPEEVFESFQVSIEKLKNGNATDALAAIEPPQSFLDSLNEEQLNEIPIAARTKATGPTFDFNAMLEKYQMEEMNGVGNNPDFDPSAIFSINETTRQEIQANNLSAIFKINPVKLEIKIPKEFEVIHYSERFTESVDSEGIQIFNSNEIIYEDGMDGFNGFILEKNEKSFNFNVIKNLETTNGFASSKEYGLDLRKMEHSGVAAWGELKVNDEEYIALYHESNSSFSFVKALGKYLLEVECEPASVNEISSIIAILGEIELG